ncbi:potassium channel family protein [Desulfurobacterium sp.]
MPPQELDYLRKNVVRKFLRILLLITSVVFFSTIGIMVIEKWPFFDALWHVIITISTVGYGEIHPLTEAGKVFTMLIIIIAFSVYAYGASTIAYMIFEGDLKKYFALKRLEKMISQMKNHTIVCGLGRTGLAAIQELHKEHIPFVIIEKNHEKINKILETYHNIRYIVGDATNDEILMKAEIKSAANLIITTSNNSDNLFITLSAKNLNPGVKIVARASEEASIPKLKMTGADEVISPNTIGGIRMASIAIRPNVVSFLDIVTRHGEIDLRLEEVKIPDDSPVHGKLLKDVQIPQKTGVIVIGIKREDGSFILNPVPTTMLLKGDTIIIIGTTEQFEKLKKLINGELHEYK